MVDDRVKEAAARLRANDYDHVGDPWGRKKDFDRWTLADAYLALLADHELSAVVQAWPMLTKDVRAVVGALMPRECVE